VTREVGRGPTIRRARANRSWPRWSPGRGGSARLLRAAYSADRSPRPARSRRSLRSWFWRARHSGWAARQAWWQAESATVHPSHSAARPSDRRAWTDARWAPWWNPVDGSSSLPGRRGTTATSGDWPGRPGGRARRNDGRRAPVEGLKASDAALDAISRRGGRSVLGNGQTPPGCREDGLGSSTPAHTAAATGGSDPQRRRTCGGHPWRIDGWDHTIGSPGRPPPEDARR